MTQELSRPGKMAFFTSERPKAQEACRALKKEYGEFPKEEADVIVALGGDGTLLEALRQTMHLGTPVYGMNCGTVGFLMNDFRIEGLDSRIAAADSADINPLQMIATDKDGQIHEAMAINEIALLRETRQTARLQIKVGDQVRLEQLICDGVLLSTPAGSTAYNLSAHGPILPIEANLLALTPISPFRPRRWRGALLPYDAEVEIIVQDADFRRVLVTADNYEVRDVVNVRGRVARDLKMTLLFDAGAGLEERVLKEQFQY